MANKKQKNNVDKILNYFQKQTDVGGFIIQKTEDKIEFDTCFSEDFLGKTTEESYSTMIVIISAMRSMADDLTKKLIDASSVPEKQVRNNIADVYYEIRKTKET